MIFQSPKRSYVLKSLLLAFMVAMGGTAYGQSGPDASFTVSRLFSDGVILQRNAVVPVWGTAPSGTSVTIAFDSLLQEVEAGPDGTWRGALEPHASGGPHALTISAGDQTLDIQDVWFGDVWIASGQSNMEWVVANSADAENEIRSANDPHIRHFKVPRTWSYDPESTLAGGEWRRTDSSHVGQFSAVGYYFARSLRTSVDIPVGILNTSWGGSRIEAWLEPDALMMAPEDLAGWLGEEKERGENLRRTFEEVHNASGTEDPGLKDGVAVWADPSLDIGEWDDITAPGYWETAGYEGLDGIAWYRTTVELTGEQIGSGQAMLHLGRIADNDMTWVNGVLVGRTNGWVPLRTYDIPTDVLHPGENTIAVRVEDGAGSGGFVPGGTNAMLLETPSASIPLPETWNFRIGKFVINPSGNVNQLPTLLYNKMIHPLLSFPITGFLWYQGESNAGNVEDAGRYAMQFQSLISSWRSAWGNDTAPFLFVSLAGFRAAPLEPGDSNWALLRESQSAALTLPNVGQAITIDIGEADDIHPRNKQDVGLRLALAARHLAYGEDLVYSGPLYRDHVVEGDRVILSFDHTGSGLVARGSQLGGFAIAGADGRFVWADARIDGNTVVVSSTSVTNPVAVRYAWADNPDRANLYNGEGLPAAPFRTDP